jgi:hypothetical protein
MLFGMDVQMSTSLSFFKFVDPNFFSRRVRMRLFKQVEAKIMQEDDNQAVPLFSRSGVQGDVNKTSKCNDRGNTTTIFIPYCVRLVT